MRKLYVAATLGVAALFFHATLANAEDGLTLATDLDDPHAAVYQESAYPSASECAACHMQIYEQWSSSSHAYASISPMFHKFEQKITDLSQGTIGTFCVRCHQQVGTQLGEKRYWPLWERSQVSREGITCITCHRVTEEYGKVNGERNIVPGDIHTPVIGAKRDGVYDEAVDRKVELRIATDETERGTKIHQKPIEFAQIGESEFCVSCHQVAVNLGIKLEVVWDQYRDSPAFRDGVTCQDCHMGKVPGVAAGYATAPSAVVNGVEINPDRRHSNHAFYGPGYPIAHPGIFPHNLNAAQWSIEEWLMFDYRAGWGSPEFEEVREPITLGFEDYHFAMQPVGGGLDSYWLLDGFDRVLARGPVGLETPASRALLADKLALIDGLIDPGAMDDAVDEALVALDDIEFAAGDLTPDVTGAVAALRAAVEALPAQAGLLDGFDDAFYALQDAVESLPEGRPEEAELEHLKALVDALRATLPPAHPEFRAAMHAVKQPLLIDFPYAWGSPIDREEAWDIVQVNIGKLEHKRELRRQVMENSSHIDGPFFQSNLRVGEDLRFKYVVTNTNPGHNLPSGSLGAQPEIWVNVALIDPDGVTIWESGYVDSIGDFADMHSLDVAAGKIDYDHQLVNFQTKFLTTNVKGTEREMYLPINLDVDQRPFLRPANIPATILNHPAFVRMEARSLPPLGSRDATYRVPAELITKPGTYRLAVRKRSRAEPIYFMRFVDATSDMEQAMNEWMVDIHPYTVEFQVQ